MVDIQKPDNMHRSTPERKQGNPKILMIDDVKEHTYIRA